jgi:hypothetical protein
MRCAELLSATESTAHGIYVLGGIAMEFEKKRVPTVVSRIVLDSLDPPPCSPHISTADRDRWREALETRWKEAYELAAMWPEALRVLATVGAEHGFKNPVTGRPMRFDGTLSAKLSILG